MTTATTPSTGHTSAVSLFKNPIRAIWNVQGENVPTLWWPSRDLDSSQTRTVLLMIPGNPGLIDYYITFLQTVHDTCQGKIDIFGASHLGHSSGRHVTDPSRLFTLQEQVESKIAIFDALTEKFPKGTRFVLAGHSMGSWLALKVLKARPNHGIEKVFELFPTIHKIADTPNGRNMKNLFKPSVRTMVGGVVNTLRFIFSAPPVLRSIVSLATGQDAEMAQVTSQKLLHGHVVRNCLFLAGQEMEQIAEMDMALIQEHSAKFVFYYGKTDEWSPIENYYEMQEKFPKVKSILCEQGMVHAFVLGHGEAMGVLVGGWINEL
ncbi:hypothetical protein BGZ81_011174 [Podila clonocystis]|nr:hypothetical protein BGZ81_011174 [Podila clonocystis]